MSKKPYTLIMDSLDLPLFSTIDELSELLRLSTRLLYCLSTLTKKYYKTKRIPKKSGSWREISIPSYTLHIVQKWILIHILNKLTPSNQSMAFRPGSSYGIKQNAIHHAQTLYGLSVDLKDFFPSISSNKIYTVFSNLGYNKFAASILTNLCTLDGKLPQGSSCSPALSNLVCRSLDKRLMGVCQKRGIIYTRYADDMYFSCDDKTLLLRYFHVFKSIIEDEGFSVNDEKTHYYTPTNKKRITGVTVVQDHINDTFELKAPKLIKRRLRAEIFRCIISGDYKNRKHILGQIAYISYIEKDNNHDFLSSIQKYIAKTASKIQYFPELVERYNNNLFFSEMPTIETIDVVLENEEQFDSFCEMLEDRKGFLSKNHIEDICQYTTWPNVIILYCGHQNIVDSGNFSD